MQRILEYDHVNLGHEPQPLFSEMIELSTDHDGKMEWHETARSVQVLIYFRNKLNFNMTKIFKYLWHCRWVKFEEEVEEGGSRWSKPHVATLSLHSLFELRSMMQVPNKTITKLQALLLALARSV